MLGGLGGVSWIDEVELVGLEVVLVKKDDGLGGEVVDTNCQRGLSGSRGTSLMGVFCL